LRARGPDGAKDGSETFYAKVYPDSTGATVHQFLSSLDHPPTLPMARQPVRLPGVLAYRPDLRLLLTEGLAGQPALPGLVHGVHSAASHSADAHVASLRAGVREAGRVLAALHGVAHAVAPSHPPGQVWRDLVRELGVVAHVWPETADAVRTSLGDGVLEATTSAERVLCHGDYTPSQVLFSDGHVSGLVDFDTVCWGDPAMDLGRFLAHLDLLLAKADGLVPQPLGRQLFEDLLGAYGDSAGCRYDGTLVGRADAFRRVALAVSALHACRQLKERRLDLALRLLRHQPDHPDDDNCPWRNA